MKLTPIASLAAVLLTALAGCSTVSTTYSPSETPATSPSASTAPGAQQLCNSVLANQTLLAWVPATIADFRGYQYSGPKPHRPLEDAFPGLDESAAGAWCGVKAGKDSIAWWAVVDGQLPEHAITINGPGSDEYVGETTQNALQVP
ncbi:MAG: hypothetical protein LWW77_12655 [Propionibacteriales bacterium]|nr:hypothetical protein [Propionibacteriales bacterium]